MSEAQDATIERLQAALDSVRDDLRVTRNELAAAKVECTILHSALRFYSGDGAWDGGNHARKILAARTPAPVVPTRLEKCPQCGAPVIQTNLGGGRTDDYCEECGWPDENRPETMVPREDAEALAKVCEGILNGTETIISMRDAFVAYRSKHNQI